MARGGKRKGAGRHKSADPTVTIRVPGSKKETIRQWLKSGEFENICPSHSQIKTNKEEVLAILHHALTLKANAGGKIKQEIRAAIGLMQKAE